MRMRTITHVTNYTVRPYTTQRKHSGFLVL